MPSIEPAAPDVPVVALTLVVDVANVMGSRPDGWWRDRAAAATRWLADLDRLVGRQVTLPHPASGEPTTRATADPSTPGTATSTVRVVAVVAVIEGRARAAVDPRPAALRVVRAERDGDSSIVDIASGLTAGDDVVLVVTADRGLRDRLPPGVQVAGPGWLRRLLE